MPHLILRQLLSDLGGFRTAGEPSARTRNAIGSNNENNKGVREEPGGPRRTLTSYRRDRGERRNAQKALADHPEL